MAKKKPKSSKEAKKKNTRPPIDTVTKTRLWVASGGRCQFDGCNTYLWKHHVTMDRMNRSYIAHIYAYSEEGPRYDSVLSPKLAKEFSNLMLVCDSCHRLFDDMEKAKTEYPAPKLIKMKEEHEERVERLTDIKQEKQSHIVVYKANIGIHTPEMSYETLRQYLPPDHYPANSYVVDLGAENSPQRDRDPKFWRFEENILETNFNEQLRPRLRKGDFKHISLFAFAPQPLLVKLGTLLNEVRDVKTYQPLKNPKTWAMPNENTEKHSIRKPDVVKSKVALVFSLSGKIVDSRITNVLGKDCAIYELTIKEPYNDYMRSYSTLEDFKKLTRLLLNEIKAVYSSNEPLYVFPAMPVSAAIELGRLWNPKADMPLHIYDENTGFNRALIIKNK